MRLPSALLLLSLPGYFSIQAPKFVRGRELGSLTVECRYEHRWQTHRKWWCRGADWDSCQILIQTTSSQQKVQGDRLSIRDNQRDGVIIVTMKDLRRDDEDTYWCGINRIGTDRGVPISVIVEPGNLFSGKISNNYMGVSSDSLIRNHYVLLVFVKVPILLIVVGAVLWLKGHLRVPEEPWEQPVYMNLSSDPANDTALRQTDETLSDLDHISRGDTDHRRDTSETSGFPALHSSQTQRRPLLEHRLCLEGQHLSPPQIENSAPHPTRAQGSGVTGWSPSSDCCVLPAGGLDTELRTATQSWRPKRRAGDRITERETAGMCEKERQRQGLGQSLVPVGPETSSTTSRPELLKYV